MRQLRVTFPHGLPGFEHERDFTLTEDGARGPITVLESNITHGLCFYALPARLVDPEYEPELNPEDCRTLELFDSRQDLDWLVILAMPDDGVLTANLLAPVAINRSRGLAVQVVRSDRRYSHEHRLGDAGCS